MDTTDLGREISRRRTFAIISHPDAGKTTLTEKLLLYSGMIRTAGMVGARKGRKAATSDWMSMEQERGISITASCMQFEYKDCKINILDTPGHQDFSEDTYRTLTAADSVIMVIDSAKGVETQTLKLFAACKLRGIPVITFVNKMDSYGRAPLELLEEVESVLGIHTSPLNWPIGSGKEFQGVVDRRRNLAHFYSRTTGGAQKPEVLSVPLAEIASCERLGESERRQLLDELELMEIAGNAFTEQAYLDFKVSPVFFGSAFYNYGVEPLFDALIELAPAPHARAADLPDGTETALEPQAEPFSAYVFKLQANMNPKHRDCIAFMRINTGRYEKDMQVIHHRTGRRIRLASPQTLFASERQTVEQAFPGDVIGVINTNEMAIGDTLSLKGGFEFKKLPSFQPEIFARISPVDLGKRKQIDKGVSQLAAEGTAQLMWDLGDSFSFPFIGVVGRLQLEVMQHRLREEYGVDTRIEILPYSCSAWLIGDHLSFKLPYNARLAQDAAKRPMVLFSSSWEKDYAKRENPKHQLVDYA